MGLLLVSGSFTTVALTGCGSSTAQTEGRGIPWDKVPAEGFASQSFGRDGEGHSRDQAGGRCRQVPVHVLFQNRGRSDGCHAQGFRQGDGQGGDRAQSVAVNITDPSEKAVVDKFDLSRAPMPGHGGGPRRCHYRRLSNQVRGTTTLGCLRHPRHGESDEVAPGRHVFVCVQNDKTKSNDAAMQGVRDFKADARFASATEIVTLYLRTRRNPPF